MLHRSQYRRTVAAWMAVVLGLLLGQAYGVNFKAYGPELYVRSHGAPLVQSGRFSVKNPNTQYTLVVVNGVSPYQPVESAVIRLNGAVVLREHDFDEHRRAIYRPVVLQSSNVVSVELRSDPGGTISVEILGLDDDPPSITASVSPQPNAAGWNHTPVTVTFTCADAFMDVTCPAPVTLDTAGANQIVSGTASDSAGITATTSVTLNLDLTPPSISAVAAPAPNQAGWNNTPVTVSFSCGDSLSGIAVCPAPATVSSDGVSQVSGTAVDKAGNSSQTTAFVSVDTTAPSVSIASPANGATVSDSALTVSGSVSDAASGVASVMCNGAAATFSGGAFSCNLSLVGGSNSIQVVATDAAGNSSSASLNVTLTLASPPPPPPPPPPPTQLDPPPTQIQITPMAITMAVGERRSVSATDTLGRGIPATFTVDDSSVLQVNSDGSMVALAAGTATVTATYQQLTAQEAVTVSPTGPLALGTERWEVQPLDVNNDWISSFVAGQPNAPGLPDLYVMEGTPTSGPYARALAGDGHQLWSTLLLPTSVTTNSAFLWDSLLLQVGTPDGGLVAFDSQTFNGGFFNYSQDSIIKVDANAHSVAWTYNSPAMLDSALAVHPSGDIYVVQTSNSSTTASAAVLALNGATGQVKFSAPLPLSSVTYQDTGYDASNNLVCQPGNTVVVPSLPNHGPLAVLPDGNVYLEVEATNTVLKACQSTGFTSVSYSDTLSLLQVQTSGASSLTGLEQFNDLVTQTHGQPGQVLPDGQGGVLAGWAKQAGSSNQAFVSRLLNGVQTDYALPWTSNFSINFAMVLGEGGTVFAQEGAFSGQILALNLNSGVSTPAAFSAQIVSALTGGGAMMADNSQIFSVDDTASQAVLSNTLGMSALSHYAGTTWLGFSNNDSSLEAAVGPELQPGVTSWPVLAGNLAGQQAPPMPVLAHFVPQQPSTQYTVTQFESDMQQAAPGSNLFYALDQASVASFLEQLDKPNDAVAFLGNPLNFDFSGTPQTVGLCFSSDCLEKALSASDPTYSLVTPSGLTTSWVDAYLLAGKTKVVFVASAYDGAIFEELWGIDATTAHQALIVPANANVSQQVAAQVWVAIARNLVAGQTVQNAVANANVQFSTTWNVVGDGTVRIKTVQ
ncbi:MAG TPA: Ig-like domain-containing protein [Terriglobales bacterium]|nr:Ig-like domain-containing protein [Terriglobales bacterium]